jgi:excisionase family DNA binding protein
MRYSSSKADTEDRAGKPLALTVVEAARLSGTSRSTIYEALQRRELEGKKLGRRTIILRDALEHYLASLPSFGAGPGERGSDNG